MSKYIDADKLKAEIERRRLSNRYIDTEGYENELLEIIDSLQQEQSELPGIERAEYYYHKGVYEGLSQGRADALKMLEEFMKVKANPVIVIKQQEQPSEDLNDEIKKFIEEYGYERGEDKLLIAIVARHFYELGLNTRKEESK